MSYLVPQQPTSFNTTIRRFETRFWEVDFNIEASATVITTGANAIRMKALLRTNNCLVGLYWRSKDRWDHPLFCYQQKIDWTNTVLTFDMTYTGSPLINDTTHPLILTVNDMSGQSYFVYLQNFMTAGSPASRTGSFSINTNTCKAGLLADQTIPWTNIDAMFIGFTSAGFVKGATLAPITELAIQADITNIAVSGTNSTVGLNNAGLTAHELLIADGFADSYNQTPERIVEQTYKLGYRTKNVLYVGFTQWLSLTWDSGVGDLQIDPAKAKINDPASQWISDYCTRHNTNGVKVVMSLSFELLTRFMPVAWGQKDYKGSISQSGWTPSSSFYTPHNTTAFAHMKDVAKGFVALGVSGNTDFQVGEPWWWPGGYNNNGPCFYDTYTQALYTSETSLPVPTPFIQTIYDDYSASAQTAYLTWLGGKLGTATVALANYVKTAFPTTKITVLFYTPTVSNPLSPMMQLVNFPTSAWASPTWDYVEVEDYEVIEFRNFKQQELDLDVPVKSLGYAKSKCEYFSGFNLLPATTFVWDAVDQALWTAFNRKGYSTCLVWARPQVCRDGWVYNHGNWATFAANGSVPSYPAFPNIATLGWDVTRAPQFNNIKSMHASGKEIRSPIAQYPIWQFGLTYEILDSNKQFTYNQMLSFFQAMGGKSGKFIFTDPEFNTCTAQYIGTGDGYRDTWAFVRTITSTYEEPISYLNAVSQVFVNGSPVSASTYTIWYANKWPSIRFNTPPAAGAIVSATFTYAFVCRFSNDNQTFEEFMSNWHTLKSLKFQSVKP